MKKGIWIILLVAIIALVAMGIWYFVYEINSGTNAPKEEKNPNIRYFDEEILKITANSSDELAELTGTVNSKYNCEIDTRRLVITSEYNNSGYFKGYFAIISVSNLCGNNFK